MQPSITLLNELLPYLDAYVATSESAPSLEDFAAWLHQKTRPAVAHPPQTLGEHSVDSQIGEYLYLLNRYTRVYSKMALKDSPLASVDDFVILMNLNGRETTKSAAIERSQLDFNTGIGIIRRLLKLGILREFSSPEDRRAKQIAITEKGQEIIGGVLERMAPVANIVMGDLAAEEKEILLRLLGQLEQYHQKNKARHLEIIDQDTEEPS